MTTPLCNLALKYGTDKCLPANHSYTPFYYEQLKDKRESFKKILELGIGYPKVMKHIKNYRIGASLYMWRDFFPNAQIYGADILPETMFKDDRIETFLCDERNKEDLVKLIKKTGNDIDLVIDDGSHHPSHQVFAFQTLMPLLKKDVIYIIEDVWVLRRVTRYLGEYNFIVPEGLHTIIVKNKI